MISIIDDIGKVVQSLREGGGYDPYYEDAYESNRSNPPYYLFGHRQEIANILTEKGQHAKQKLKKFPMIALKTDIIETQRGNVIDFNLNIVIAVSTKIEYSESERMEKNFIPILYPLLDQFKQAFSDSGLGFFWEGDLTFPPTNKIDRAFYGTPDAQGNNRKNIFNEPVDAIEIVNLKFSKQDYLN